MLVCSVKTPTQKVCISASAFSDVFFLFSAGPKEFFYRGHNYFYSGHVPALAGRKVDWLDGRNICREYCMDLVSMETQEENNLIFKLIQQSEFSYYDQRLSKSLGVS